MILMKFLPERVAFGVFVASCNGFSGWIVAIDTVERDFNCFFLHLDCSVFFLHFGSSVIA